MSFEIFNNIEDSLKRMGEKSPNWVKTRTEPAIHVTQTGVSGPNILLLHGLFGAVSNWDNILPSMSQYAKLLAFKFPILTGTKLEVRVKALAALTEYYIRKNDLAPMIICGNSLGGHVALRVALSSPGLVSKIILSGSSGLYEHTVDSLPVRPDSSFVREHMDRVFYNKEFITEEGIKEIADILNNKTARVNLIHSAKSAKRDNLSKLLPQLKAETLLLWGEEDRITDMKVGKSFNDLIPNSKLESCAECGHAPMIEKPDWFSERVKEFVS